MFIVLHELGHIILQSNYFTFAPFIKRHVGHEIEADRFASVFIGKNNVRNFLEKLELFLIKNSADSVEMKIRILALDMPTLFYRYAN